MSRLYLVNVSRLPVLRKPSVLNSRVGLNRNTVVKVYGPPVKCKDDTWVLVETVNEPIVKGYVQLKYLIKM